MTGRFEWEQAIRSSDLRLTARCAAYVIATYSNGDGSGAFPSFPTIAAGMGAGLTAAKAGVRELVEAGWLTKHSSPGRVNRYTLSIPATWSASAPADEVTQSPHDRVTQSPHDPVAQPTRSPHDPHPVAPPTDTRSPHDPDQSSYQSNDQSIRSEEEIARIEEDPDDLDSPHAVIDIAAVYAEPNADRTTSRSEEVRALTRPQRLKLDALVAGLASDGWEGLAQAFSHDTAQVSKLSFPEIVRRRAKDPAKWGAWKAEKTTVVVPSVAPPAPVAPLRMFRVEPRQLPTGDLRVAVEHTISEMGCGEENWRTQPDEDQIEFETKAQAWLDAGIRANRIGHRLIGNVRPDGPAMYRPARWLLDRAHLLDETLADEGDAVCEPNGSTEN